jgi:RNA ligase partner protein
MKTQRFVLDTSAFTGLSDSKASIEKHISKLILLISKARKANISCYVPPSVWKELKAMLERKKISRTLIEKLDAWTIEKSPSRFETSIPAEFLYEYVKEIREHINKGLREAEKAVIKTHHKPETHEKVISELRDGYRKAMRKGLLDSEEDLDVLLLGKELNAGIVASDEGILSWAKQWGIRYEDANTFRRLLEEHLKK